MHSPTRQCPSELFSLTRLTAEPIRTLIATAPTGLALRQSLRNENGQIADFFYQFLQSCALTNHLPRDLQSQLLTSLSSDVVETGMLARLIQVVNTGDRASMWKSTLPGREC